MCSRKGAGAVPAEVGHMVRTAPAILWPVEKVGDEYRGASGVAMWPLW